MQLTKAYEVIDSATYMLKISLSLTRAPIIIIIIIIINKNISPRNMAVVQIKNMVALCKDSLACHYYRFV